MEQEETFEPLVRKIADFELEIETLRSSYGRLGKPGRSRNLAGTITIVAVVVALALALSIGLLPSTSFAGLTIVTLTSVIISVVVLALTVFLANGLTRMHSQLAQIRKAQKDLIRLESELARRAIDSLDTRLRILEEMRELYRRIYAWHTSQGQQGARELEDPSAVARYLALLARLPPPEFAQPEDMAFLAEQVLSGDLEWSRGQKDTFGVTVGDYARRIQRIASDSRVKRPNSF